MRLFISTSDKHLWALRPCLHLLGKHWPEHPPVIVAGFSAPEFELPAKVDYFSIGNMDDYPFEKWSDGVIKALNVIDDELITWWMEDFWPVRAVDHSAVCLLRDYMLTYPAIARTDLTTDRLYAEGVNDLGALEWLDLINNHRHVPYTLSFQPGIWRRKSLMRYLIPDETPYETEIRGTQRMIDDDAQVIGTRQSPVKILIAIQQGRLTLDGGYQVPRPILTKDDLDELIGLGYLNVESQT